MAERQIRGSPENIFVREYFHLTSSTLLHFHHSISPCQVDVVEMGNEEQAWVLNLFPLPKPHDDLSSFEQDSNIWLRHISNIVNSYFSFRAEVRPHLDITEKERSSSPRLIYCRVL